MRRVREYESSIVGSYSEVHCERTRRRVMDDLPQPPSPQMVIVMGIGGCAGSAIVGVVALCGGSRGRFRCASRVVRFWVRGYSSMSSVVALSVSSDGVSARFFYWGEPRIRSLNRRLKS